MTRLIIVWIILFGIYSISTASPSTPSRFRAPVSRIIDGDTLIAKVNGYPIKMRLHEIDAPESNQNYGTKASQHLKKITVDRIIQIEVKSIDRYGRWIIEAIHNETSINTAMIEACLAWTHPKYTQRTDRINASKKCKTKKLNIWSEANPIPPWRFRKQKVKERSSLLNQPRISHYLPEHPALSHGQDLQYTV